MVQANGTSTVARIAVHAVVSLDAAASIEEAAKTMAKRRIGSVAVRERGQLVGLVTERDLALAVLVHGAAASRPVAEALRREVPRVEAGASVDACAALMRDHATRHLLVEERGDVIGVVSMRDIVRATLEEKQFLIEQLATYINGYGAPAELSPVA
jgi:CBS domain-containing protein